MNKNKYLAGTAALALLLTAGASSVYAYHGDPSVQGPNYSDDRHEAMEQAFEDVDYDAWVALMDGRGRVTEVVTEENFADFAEMHELMEEGDVAGAQAIREDLGLGQGSMMRGEGRGAGAGARGAHREGMQNGACDGTGVRANG